MSVRYIGGRRFGVWITRRPTVVRRGVVSAPDFVEVSALGRVLGVCW